MHVKHIFLELKKYPEFRHTCTPKNAGGVVRRRCSRRQSKTDCCCCNADSWDQRGIAVLNLDTGDPGEAWTACAKTKWMGTRPWRASPPLHASDRFSLANYPLKTASLSPFYFPSFPLPPAVSAVLDLSSYLLFTPFLPLASLSPPTTRLTHTNPTRRTKNN